MMRTATGWGRVVVVVVLLLSEPHGSAQPEQRTELPEPSNVRALPSNDGWEIYATYALPERAGARISKNSIAEAVLLVVVPERSPGEFRRQDEGGWTPLSGATETVPLTVSNHSLTISFSMGKDRLPDEIGWVAVQARIELKDGTVFHCRPAVAPKPPRPVLVHTVPKLIGKRDLRKLRPIECYASSKRPSLFVRTAVGTLHALSLPDLTDEMEPFEIGSGIDRSICQAGGFLFVQARGEKNDRLLVLDEAQLALVFEFELGHVMDRPPVVSGDGKLLVWTFRESREDETRIALFEWRKPGARPVTFDLQKVAKASPLALPGTVMNRRPTVATAIPAALSPDGSVLLMQAGSDQYLYRILLGKPFYVVDIPGLGTHPQFDRTGAIVAFAAGSTQLYLVKDLLEGGREQPVAVFGERVASAPIYLEGAGLIASGGSIFDGRGRKVFEIPPQMQTPGSREAEHSCACNDGNWIAFLGRNGIHLFDVTKRMQPGSF